MSTPIDALGDELKRRMENPFWGSFIISWLLINWKIVYVTLSWSSNEIDDKIKYIEKLYGFSSFFEGFSSIVHLFIFPLIASAIAIWWIPILAREYLKKQIKNKEEDDKLRIKEIKSEKLVVQEKIDLQKEEEELERSEYVIWDNEFDKLIKKYPEFWKSLTSLIYEYDGDSGFNIQDEYGDYSNVFNHGEIQLLDVNGLIERNENSSRYYHITEKGKYFLKKQSLEN